MEKEQYYIAITPNNEIIGVIGCLIEYGHCKLIHMAVLKEFRWKRIGSLLLQKAESYAKENKASKIWLDTSTRLTKSIIFYQRKGFKSIGEHEKYLLGDDIILFEKIL